MEPELEKCLICDSSDQGPLHSLLDPFPHWEVTGRTSRGKGTTTSVLLNQQLSVIFLLRRVLRLEASFLEATLRRTGSNPAAWNLRLCRVCYRTFEEADFVFSRLRKLQTEFDELSGILCGKLKASVGLEGGGNGGDECELATKRKRRQVGRPARKGRRKRHEMGTAMESDVEDGSVPVADSIRREMIKQRDAGKSDDRPCIKNIQEPFAVTTNSSSVIVKSSMKSMKTESTLAKNTDVHFEDNTEMSRDDNLSDGEIPPDDYHDDLDYDMPELVKETTVDLDYIPSPATAADGESVEELEDEDNYEAEDVPDEDDSDSDFEISRRSTRSRRPKKTSKRMGKKNASRDGIDSGIILKAVKMENATTYSCPKCKDVFESDALCDEHILHYHYNGKWPKQFSCHLCENVSFKGAFWLQHHYKMRHPGEKSAVDEALERAMDEGTMTELTYEVIPAGQTVEFPEEGSEKIEEVHEEGVLFNRTVDQPPKNALSIPVVQGFGQTRYLVLPNCIKQIPTVFSLLQTGPEDKLCSRCSKSFPTEMQLRAHFNRVHEGETMPYDCPLCPKKFERIGKVLLHVQRAHIQSKHICDKCGNTYKEEILLKAHIQRDHFGVQYPYKCVACDVRYPRRNALNKHLKVTHKLQIASYFLLSKPKPRPRQPGALIKRRRKRVKLEKKFPCKTCIENGKFEMKFVSEEDLDIHVKRRHMGISRPYACSICGKKYSKPAIVEQHMKTHTVRSDLHIDDKEPPLPFICHPCDKQFRTRYLYNVHMKGTRHQDVRRFVCELCSKGFTGLKYLQNHQSLMHHKELNIDPFKCKFCNKVLSSQRTLNDHVKLRHTKDANFSCPYCDVQFQHKSNMEHHVNALHSKAQKFLCPQCPKTFLRDFYLKNHFQRVHSGLQPYECQHCLKKFSDKPTYNRHVEAHSNVVHSCPHCGKSGFKTRHALRVHLKTLHKDELDELERKKKLEAIVRPQDIVAQVNEIVPSSESFVESSQDEGNVVAKVEDLESQCQTNQFANVHLFL